VRPGVERGQAVIEFAIILPVLVLIIGGIVKFGILYNHYVTLTDAVRAGSRQLALGRGLPAPCGPAVTRTINAAKPALTLTDANIKVTLLNPDACETPLRTGTNGSMVQGDEAKIEASYPCDLKIFGINFLPGCTLHASASEAIE
jgi:uncharacterized protein (UPF0333 family)